MAENRKPNPELGEYEDEDGSIKVCKACIPGTRVIRHTCGLAELQKMFSI